MQHGHIPIVHYLAHPFGVKAIAACALALALAQDAVASRNPFVPPQMHEALPEAPRAEVRSQNVLIEQYRDDIVRHIEAQSSLVAVIDSQQRMYLEPLAGCYFKTSPSGLSPSICADHIMRHVYVHQDGGVEYPRRRPQVAGEISSSPESSAVDIVADSQSKRFAEASCSSAFDSISRLADDYPGRVINFTSENDAIEEGFERVDQSEC